MRILIVEDERALCDTLAKSLKRKGYETDVCYDGESALEWMLAEKYDLILLDLNLPGRDGMELLRALRERDRETRVLILSARSRISDKVEGLDCGANDYLVKPFHLEELEARVRSLTRRSFVQHDALLSCGRVTFDTVKRTAQVNGEAVALTRKENGILEYLLLNQGRPVSQEEPPATPTWIPSAAMCCIKRTRSPSPSASICRRSSGRTCPSASPGSLWWS